jgi:hypothetical protein
LFKLELIDRKTKELFLLAEIDEHPHPAELEGDA